MPRESVRRSGWAAQWRRICVAEGNDPGPETPGAAVFADGLPEEPGTANLGHGR